MNISRIEAVAKRKKIDLLNVLVNIRVGIFHEVAHGLIEYIPYIVQDCEVREEIDKNSKLSRIAREIEETDDEELCEWFGESLAGVEPAISPLEKFFDELDKIRASTT